MFNTLKTLLLGKARDPFSKENRQHMALVAFLAWIGLGADGLSSSCYGPELGYLALGHYEHLALYLAGLTTFTVFLIALSYNQVIELFPTGGGGYRVANELLGPFAGVVSGSALLVDYMLTISMSVASGVKALFSLVPTGFHQHIIPIEVGVVLLLMYLNVRGIKESIKILMPIFLGFFITHVLIICFGIYSHSYEIPHMIQSTLAETHDAVNFVGVGALIAILLKAYSLGSGTYTGLEAVSNNVNMLAEPRVRTGKLTMFYMAASLSFVACGIILLYLLWSVHPIADMTLNAVVFQKILGDTAVGKALLLVMLVFEAGLLFVGANTGFLGGPAVLANMAQDSWVPRQFSNLSSRLVKQNGVLFFGLIAAFTIIVTGGSVEKLVIAYSINVFITFSYSLLGLVVYWWTQRKEQKGIWVQRIALSLLGFVICFFILLTIVFTKLNEGSWISILMTLLLVAGCYYLKSCYKEYELLKDELDKTLDVHLIEPPANAPKPHLDPEKPTAVFLVKDFGGTMHTMLWVERMFPKHFKNYVFLCYGEVDTQSYNSDSALKKLELKTARTVRSLQRVALANQVATLVKVKYGTTPVDGIADMVHEIDELFPNCVYFAARHVHPNENILTRLLHSQSALLVQKRLQGMGAKMLIVPLNLHN